MAEIDNWVEAQEFQITLDAQGKIIDYIDNETRRPNTPEERIRQKMVQVLHCEFGYPLANIGLERSIIALLTKAVTPLQQVYNRHRR